MKELQEWESYVLFSDRFLRHNRSNIHAKPACRSRKRLTNQEFMPSDYYTSYIPFITATPKEDFISLGNTDRQQVGERKVFKNKGVLFYGILCVSISSFFLMALKNIRILYLGFLCFMLFNLSDAWAQSPENGEAAEGQTEIKPLRVGDYVPKDFWEKQFIIYKQGDTIQTDLATYQGNSLLLGFWATWCGYCISGFPSLVSFSNDYSDHINILLINDTNTRDTYEKIHGMPTDILRSNTLPSIINDSYLSKLFPHGPIPHYIWINPKGRVAAITFSEFINREQVEIFIDRNLKYEED